MMSRLVIATFLLWLCLSASLLVGCSESAEARDEAKVASEAPSGDRPAVLAARGADEHQAEKLSDIADIVFATDAPYAAILDAVVDEDGFVRYDRLALEPLRAQLNSVVAGYAAERLPERGHQLARAALWCNAYNANMLQIALVESARPGFTTINQVPGIFDARSITVAGESMTLNQMKDRLRALGDPRIHAAIVYAARGCPPLRREPYVGDRLNEQLNQQALIWLDDSNRHRPVRSGLMLSEVFQWHAQDFEVAPYHGPLGFIRKHGRPGGALREMIRGVGGSPRIGYLRFNWILNTPLLPPPAES
jgi:hypothetical protein